MSAISDGLTNRSVSPFNNQTVLAHSRPTDTKLQSANRVPSRSVTSTCCPSTALKHATWITSLSDPAVPGCYGIRPVS
jgi:hypothetical protein